jgi:hypothetical protein
MAEEWHAPSASATPWDGSDDSSLTPAQRLVRGAHREAYERLHPGVGGDAEFLNGYERDACPLCRSPGPTRWGHDRNGVRRWRCRACGATFTPATGTIFEGHRLPVAAWSEFLLELFSYESLAGMTRQNRRSPTTLPYQLAKLSMVLRGIRDSVALSGRVQADEMMYRVPAAGRDPSLAGRRAGGYSRNNTCIAIACEERDGGSSVFAALGRGKPSAARARAAYCPHLADGCTLVHDRENSHNAVVRERHLVSEAYDSRLVKSLPDGENPLARVMGFAHGPELSHHGVALSLSLSWAGTGPSDRCGRYESESESAPVWLAIGVPPRHDWRDEELEADHGEAEPEVHGRVQAEGVGALPLGRRRHIRVDRARDRRRPEQRRQLGEEGGGGHDACRGPLPDGRGAQDAAQGEREAQGGERDTFKSQRLLREQGAVGLAAERAKFEFVAGHLGEHGVSAVCRAPGVSRQGCCQRASRPESAHDARDREPEGAIGEEYEASRGIYGAPKVREMLRRRGVRTSRKRVARIMPRDGWRGATRACARRASGEERASKAESAEGLVDATSRPTARTGRGSAT